MGKKKPARDRSWARGACVAAVAAAAGLVFLTPLGADVEAVYGLGTLFHLRGPLPPPPEVAVVAIDRSTLEWAATRLGLSEPPRVLPRVLHAELIDSLVAHGAMAIVFDLRFVATTQDDESFSDAIRRSEPAGVPVALLEDLERETEAAARPRLLLDQANGARPDVAEAAFAIAPFPLPRDTERVAGFWTFRSDQPTLPAIALHLASRDIARDWAELLETQGALVREAQVWRDRRLVPAMIDLRRRLRDRPDLGERLRRAAATWAEPRKNRLEALVSLYTGDDNRLLNLRGPPGSIATIPYAQIVTGSATEKAAIEGKIVIVGRSELRIPSQQDSFETVYTSRDGIRLSGAEILATALANLMADASIRTSALMNMLIVLAVAATIGMAASSASAWPLAASTAILPVTLGLLACALFAGANVFVPVFAPLAAELPAGVLTAAFLLRRAERKLRRSIDRAARQYLPRMVADSLAEGPLEPGESPGHETKFAVCLATDASGFTAVSEAMPPDALHDLLNAYYQPLFEVIQRRGGIIANVTADALMCAWTARDPVQARANAVLTGLEMRELVGAFNARHPTAPLPTRFGLHAGLAMFAAVGGGGHYAYRVFGDIANTAARIESLNKLFRSSILASKEVLAGAENLLIRPLGRFLLVGKSQPVEVMEVIGPVAENREKIPVFDAFAHGLELYRSGQWEAAAVYFRALQATYPEDGPTAFYSEQSMARAKSPSAIGAGDAIRIQTK